MFQWCLYLNVLLVESFDHFPAGYENFFSSGPQYADIVFLHGLLGDPFKTWRQRERPTKSMMQSLRDSQFAEKVRKLIRSTVSEEETASAILSVLDNKPPSSCWPRV